MRTAQGTIAVEVHRNPAEPATVVVRLEGELDVTTAPLLQTVVDQILTGRRDRACTVLVLDMSGVSFADASGISPILLARALISRRGGRVELRHCQRPVLRLLRILDLDGLLAEAG
ncbi:MAG: anti-sigma factor antagonist [Actinomycetota bacterium]|nr:anti-sigma factor antagonist [Actinomycetota bacterium]